METMELTPNKLMALCEVDWSALGVGWPPEGSLDKTVANEVYKVIVGKPGHPDQFPYVIAGRMVSSGQYTWLRPFLEEAFRVMIARMAATSKCREKTKERILPGEPVEVPLPYVSLYPLLPRAPSSIPPTPTLDGEARGTITPVKSGLEAPGAPTPLTSLSPMDPMPTPNTPVLTHLPHSIGGI
jgi:hypothetical protein